jgi:hypothetical protein
MNFDSESLSNLENQRISKEFQAIEGNYNEENKENA